jgi:phage major head subunit gpT-like protein
MLGPTIAQRTKYAEAEVGITVEFMHQLEANGPDPLLVLANEVESKAALERHFFLGDVPGFQKWKGDRVMSTLMAHSFTIVNDDFASGITIHRNEIMDDKLGLVAPRIADLAGKAARFKGDYMMMALINGFSGTAFPSEVGDGKSFDGSLFFSTTHSLEGGPAMSNKITTALSEAGLEEAEILMKTFKTWDGKDPLNMSPTHLIVGPKLKNTAMKLLNAGTIINAAGTASAVNVHAGKYQIIESQRLTGAYDDYWFLADLSKATKPFIFQDREPITTAAQIDWSSDDMYKRGQMNFGAQARAGIGPYDWRTVVGALV